MKKYLTPNEAAELLAVDVSWIYGQSHQRKFPPNVALKVGRYLRLDEDALIAWLKDETE